MHYQMRGVAMALLVSSVANVAMAQDAQRRVSGTVKSDFGTVVSGASVCVKGGETCATTNAQGEYEIMASQGDVLVVSNEGYAQTEIIVSGERNQDIQMVIEDLFAMDLEDLMNTQVQSSSFVTLTAKEAPGYTFTYELGDQMGQQSLIDIIKMVIPGYSDGSHTDTEIFGVRGMKVVDNSKSIVMYDGQNLNLRSNIGYGVGLGSMLLGDVRGLEVSLGPNALVHGSGAISGYINMLPKNGYDDSGFTINVNKEFEHAAQNQKSGISKAEIGYGFGSQRRNAYFYAGWYHSNGWQADSAFMSNVEPGANYSDVMERMSVGSTPRANFRLSGNANFDDFNIQVAFTQASRTSLPSVKLNSGAYVIQDADILENFTRQFNARLRWSHDFNDYERLAISFSNELTDLARVTDGTQRGGSESHIEAKIVASTKRIANNQLAIGGLVGGRKFHAGKYYFGHDVDYVSIAESGDYMNDPDLKGPYKIEVIDPETGETKKVNDPTKVWSSGQMPNGKWNEWAIFAEDVYKIEDVLVIALGLRYDCFNVKAFDDDQGSLSPRVALSWIAADNHVVKASYQQGFRTMDFYNRAQTYYRKDADMQYGFRNATQNIGYESFRFKIDPEKLHSFEVNYHGDFASKMLSLDANVFFNKYEKTIDFIKIMDWNGKKSNGYTGEDRIDVGDYYGDYTTTGKAYLTEAQQRAFSDGYLDKQRKTKGKDATYSAYVNNGEDINIIGGEVIASLSLPSSTSARVAYSLADATTDSYADATIAPKQSLKVSATQKLFSDRLAISAQYLWEPAIEDNDQNTVNYSEVYFDPRNLLDATISFRPVPQLMLYATANNILGESRPALTYKPDPVNNYPQFTQLGCGERRYWIGIKVNL